jgi:uncharacterized membrane protein (GlpM family)
MGELEAFGVGAIFAALIVLSWRQRNVALLGISTLLGAFAVAAEWTNGTAYAVQHAKHDAAMWVIFVLGTAFVYWRRCR